VSGTENVSGIWSETVCSEQERANESETWSGIWSETWTWKAICLLACFLLRSSSLGCGWQTWQTWQTWLIWQTWSGSWSGCDSWSDFSNESSCGSGSCCDWEKREKTAM